MKNTMQRRGMAPKNKAGSGSQRSGSNGRFNEYPQRRNRGAENQKRYEGDDEDFYEYRESDLNQEYDADDYGYVWDEREEDYYEQQGRPRSTQYSPVYYDLQDRETLRNRAPRFRKVYTGPYRENPSNRRTEEFRGTTRRRQDPGNYDNRDFYNESNQQRNERHGGAGYIERHYGISNQNNDRSNERHNGRSEYRNYMDRGQFENEFHDIDIYPSEGNYEYDDEMTHRDRPYKYDGYQSFGNSEGFGNRGKIHHGQDWRDEDEYREGHASRKMGYGKFGSR